MPPLLELLHFLPHLLPCLPLLLLLLLLLLFLLSSSSNSSSTFSSSSSSPSSSSACSRSSSLSSSPSSFSTLDVEHRAPNGRFRTTFVLQKVDSRATKLSAPSSERPFSYYNCIHETSEDRSHTSETPRSSRGLPAFARRRIVLVPDHHDWNFHLRKLCRCRLNFQKMVGKTYRMLLFC